MPRSVQVSRHLPAVQHGQDWVLAREQALAHGLTRHAIGHRLATGRWQVLLPSVYLCQPGEPSRRQMMIGALLFAGPESAIDGVDACRFHGVRAAAVDERLVHVVTPWGSAARSRGYVRVRRTCRPIDMVHSERLRYLEPAAAAIAACRDTRNERMALALLAETVQRRLVTPQRLLAAHAVGPPRGARSTGAALEHVAAGVQSVGEKDARVLLEASAILPAPIYNCLLRLPGGRLISPDALIVDAGLVHETNGRVAHAREDLFEDMQERHDVMTAAGLTVLHNSPRRLWRQGPNVLDEVERCYLRLAGRGLPPGVEIVRMAI